MRTALADKLEDAGLPWAPSAEAARGRRRGRGAASALRGIKGNEKARKGAAYMAAAALVVALWGGYVRGWQWTGFRVNGQLWDWLTLLLLPVVLGTIPLWIQDKEYIGKGRRVIYAVAIVAWTGFVIAGYLIPLNWTGFRGQTLWGWFELLVLPAALTTMMALTSMRARLPKAPLAAPVSEGNHRRPGRRVDRDRDRRLRPAVDVDRLSRNTLWDWLGAAPAAGVPDHLASGLAQMGLGQCGRACQPGTRGGRGRDGDTRVRNVAAADIFALSAATVVSAVVRRQVRAEGVVAEVGRRITPHRVGVVRLALGVVVLDEQPRALQPVVMRLAGAGGPGPGQVHGVQRGVVGVVRLRRQAVRDAPSVGGQQRAQQVPLPGVKFPGRQALRDAGQRDPLMVAGVVAGGSFGAVAHLGHPFVEPAAR